MGQRRIHPNKSRSANRLAANSPAIIYQKNHITSARNLQAGQATYGVFMKTIPLSRGFSTIVDDGDFDFLNEHNWLAMSVGELNYATRFIRKDGQVITVLMHREILQIPKEMVIDHIDGNGLNNLRSNLRPCTRQQNQCNRKMSRKNTSGFKGVFWYPRQSKWAANIKKNGKNHWLGTFDDKGAAAIAYDNAALELFGPFAKSNHMMGLI